MLRICSEYDQIWQESVKYCSTSISIQPLHSLNVSMPRYFLASTLNLASDLTRSSHCFPINEMPLADGLLPSQLKDWIICNLLDYIWGNCWIDTGRCSLLFLKFQAGNYPGSFSRYASLPVTPLIQAASGLVSVLNWLSAWFKHTSEAGAGLPLGIQVAITSMADGLLVQVVSALDISSSQHANCSGVGVSESCSK